MGARPRRVYSLTENKKLRVSVVGATGYTGAELLRILVQHPNAELSQITSRADAGKPIAESWPNFRDVDLIYSAPDVKQIAEHSDVVFFATPHTVAMAMVPALIEAGCTVVHERLERLRVRRVHPTQEHLLGIGGQLRLERLRR